MLAWGCYHGLVGVFNGELAGSSRGELAGSSGGVLAGSSSGALAGSSWGVQDLVPSIGWEGGSCALPIPLLPLMVTEVYLGREGRRWGGSSHMTRLSALFLCKKKKKPEKS